MGEPAGDGRRPAVVSLATIEPTTVGSGFVSGLLSAILGIAAFGAVLALRFPQFLTVDDLRGLYALPYLRAVIHLALVASFLLGSVSAFLRTNKALALTGIGFTLAAALLGGSQAPLGAAATDGAWLGLDFFVRHHSAEHEAMDRNFAVHTPIWDRLFGTYYLPDRWPAAYGLIAGPPVPRRWVTQLIHPFRRRPRHGAAGRPT